MAKSARQLKVPKPKRAKDVAEEEPKPLQAKSSVKDAAETMRTLETEEFPVAAGDKLIGAVKGRFTDRKVAGYGHDPATTTVGEYMANDFAYCYADESVEKAREIMREHKLKHLPVVDRKLRIVGIVTLAHLNKKV